MHKPILVTGASSGIGEATAVYLAHKGFRVFAAARRLETLAPLSGLGHGRIEPVELDVTNADSISDAVRDIRRVTDGPLYGVVNNAGIAVAGPVETVPLDAWRAQFETNVFGVVGLIQAVLPDMRAAGHGRIVNIGSVAGRIALPFMGPYAATKHALEGLTDSLRRELAHTGVRVSLIRPTFINTHFGEKEQGELAGHMAPGAPYADRVRTFSKWHERRHPVASSPTVVAEAVHRALTAQTPQDRYTVGEGKFGPSVMRTFFSNPNDGFHA